MAKKSFWQRGEDYAKKVSDELIDQIKRGVAPWQKPWKPGEQISAENFSTGQKYSGGNSLYLMSRGIREGRGDNRWGTYNQIREAGGQVRKGEKGTQVLFFTDRTAKAAKDEQGKTLKDKEGKTIYEEEQRSRPICKQYTVFNVEQAEGLELKPREGRVRPEWDAHRDAEKVIAAAGPKVEHVAGDRAYYRIAEDKIVLPEPSQFPTRNGYYQTALHECGHSTGHPDRMNRDTLKDGLENGFGSSEYAREELRAEISAMMTGERVGVGHDPQRGAPRSLTPGGAPLHPGRSGEPACGGQRSGPRSRFHGAADGAVLVASDQSRQPDSLYPSERPLHALHDGGWWLQAALRQPAPPAAGLGLDRSGTDPKPCADSGFFAVRVHADAGYGRS